MPPIRRVFRIKVYNGLKICFFLLETAELLVPTGKLQDFWCRLANSRDFTLFNINSERRYIPLARSASADNLTSVKILVY
jgi:hypothetical protein